jgi:hypothetical protein
MSTFHKVMLSLVVMASFFVGGCQKSESVAEQPAVAPVEAPATAPAETPAVEAPAAEQPAAQNPQ